MANYVIKSLYLSKPYFHFSIYFPVYYIVKHFHHHKDLDSLKNDFKRKLEQNLYCKKWRSCFIP